MKQYGVTIQSRVSINLPDNLTNDQIHEMAQGAVVDLFNTSDAVYDELLSDLEVVEIWKE